MGVSGRVVLVVVTLLLSIPCAAVEDELVSSVEVPFSLETDALCFINQPSTFVGKVWPPLQNIADKGGACQGLVGVTRAFLNNVELTCSGKKPTEEELRRSAKKALSLHRYNCSERVPIEGYCSLREMCKDYLPWFQQQSVYENAFLTLRDTAKHYIGLKSGLTNYSPETDARALSEIKALLNSGKTAFILYPMHVVLVRGVTIVRLGNGTHRLTLSVYDPNDNLSFRSLNYLLNAELTRTIGNTKPVFHVTPDSQYSLCD